MHPYRSPHVDPFWERSSPRLYVLNTGGDVPHFSMVWDVCRCIYMATAQYERSGTRASAHPDPDPDPELRIKSPNSVPDPSVPDHRMQYLKSDVELRVRSIPVPYLFHTRSRPNKVFSTYSPCIIAGTSKRQSSFHTLRIKYAIQTLRIRQHRNVHSGHGVLMSSHI